MLNSCVSSLKSGSQNMTSWERVRVKNGFILSEEDFSTEQLKRTEKISGGKKCGSKEANRTDLT